MKNKNVQKVCICADDFGLSNSISEGIINLCKKKKLQAVSCMVRGRAFNKYYLKLKKLKKNCDIGLHIDLTESTKIINLRYFKIFEILKLILTLNFKKKEIAKEIKKQISIFKKKFKFEPKFIDSHHHIHLIPGVIKFIHKSLGNDIFFIRSCDDKPKSIILRNTAIIKTLFLSFFSKILICYLKKNHIKYNTSFSGAYYFVSSIKYKKKFQKFIKYRSAKHLVMCHPAKPFVKDFYQDKILSYRIAEFEYFNSKGFEHLIHKHKIKFFKFSEF